MGKIIGFLKFAILCMLIVAMFLVSGKIPAVKNQIAAQLGFHITEVAGAQTSLDAELKRDVGGYVGAAKQKFMDMKLSDVVKKMQQAQKISSSAAQTQKEAQKLFDNLLGK